MPEFIEPQLALLVDKPPGIGWVHEVKFDGYRMQARIQKGKVVLRSRRGLDWTYRFPEIAKACSSLKDSIIDGEICALKKDGTPSFAGLQEALSTKKTAGLVFYVFDLLWLEGEDYRPWALETRKSVLEKHVAKAGKEVRYVDHMTADAQAMFSSACQMSLEGIVSKKAEAPYKSGRVGFWHKIKCRPRQELVIGGWETNDGHFSSLMLGAHRGGKFCYVGTAGTGFNSKNLPPILKQLKALEVPATPFQVASPKRSRDRHFVRPEIVCEVAFETWTRSGKIRQASFKGLREDKTPSEIIVEEPSHE